MNQAEEDALVEQSLIESTVQSDANVRFTLGDAIRLAIRAAVAQERERAARVCEQVAGRDDTDWYGPAECAAAIRKGE